jgi:hypothetical protein
VEGRGKAGHSSPNVESFPAPRNPVLPEISRHSVCKLCCYARHLFPFSLARIRRKRKNPPARTVPAVGCLLLEREKSLRHEPPRARTHPTTQTACLGSGDLVDASEHAHNYKRKGRLAATLSAAGPPSDAMPFPKSSGSSATDRKEEATDLGPHMAARRGFDGSKPADVRSSCANAKHFSCCGAVA